MPAAVPMTAAQAEKPEEAKAEETQNAPAAEEAAQPAPASPLDEKMQKVFKLTQDGKNKEIGQAVQEALDNSF